MAHQEKHYFEFGPFRIEHSERVLRRGTKVIPLTPKAVETLLVLASSQGRVVEKDELLRRVWPDTFVEEGGLARNISSLRKALGSGPHDKSYIETIARRGYRFAASVREVRDGGAEARSLAVLPLANLSKDTAQDFFADGMTDELISYLMKIESLRVSPRTSAMVYKEAHKSLRQIARELKVGWVVEGTVLQSNDRVRISARLIDGATEEHLWTQTYEKDLRNVLALQSEVASDIAREIRVKLTSPEKVKLGQFRPVNPDAYQDYLRGRYFLNHRTIDGLKRARSYFHEAIDKDSTYAPAHGGLADAYAMLASTGYDVLAPRESMPLAKMAAAKALRLDDALAEAHAALGYVKLVYDWDWVGAERELQRAIELNPGYATAHQWRGELLLALNRPEAIQAFQRAVEIDPLSIPCNLGLGWSYYFSKDYDLAIDQHRKTLEIAPNVPMALYGLGLAYHHKRQPQRALDELQKALAYLGEEPAALMLVGITHALTGMHETARADLEQLHALSRQKYVPAVYSAFIYIALDDLDCAFQWLEKAFAERSSYLVFLGVQPAMDNIRADPRYQDFVRRLGLK
jgi:TolB-like protein/Tfp pilus assembly protein PilF